MQSIVPNHVQNSMKHDMEFEKIGKLWMKSQHLAKKSSVKNFWASSFLVEAVKSDLHVMKKIFPTPSVFFRKRARYAVTFYAKLSCYSETIIKLKTAQSFQIRQCELDNGCRSLDNDIYIYIYIYTNKINGFRKFSIDQV